MGGSFSHGQDNDELVDNLVESGYIRSKKIEQVFRAVDRGDYFHVSQKDAAYKDYAWKLGNIHLSAPCIYCEVMEELALKPGLSFLNLGSGTGYLNTMVGLLLTESGLNHGIELHEDCVKFSYDRLEEFKQKSLALDEFDFCEPSFVQGNCLSIVPGRRYDRVYCGAACPDSHEAVIKEFVKVGGILIMPFRDHLIKAKRVEENVWEHQTILPVSFTNLVIPSSSEVTCQLPECDPLSLQELCRGKIRRRLRQNVWLEHADLEMRMPISTERNQPNPPKYSQRQFVIPIFEESEENPTDENDESRVHSTRLLLNLNGPSGDGLHTTLQFVRSVIHRNRNEDEDFNWPDVGESSSTDEDTNYNTTFSSERERQDSESSSDSACENSQSESNNVDNSDPCDERPVPTTSLSAYSNMSESESDQEDDNNEKEKMDVQLQPQVPSQRKKPSRKDKADSGIVEDSCNTGNDEASFSSDSDFTSGTPVKHKRINSCATSKTKSNGRSESSNKRSRCRRSGNKDTTYSAHYVDTNAFSSYMKEKIHKLPLPYSLKLYINYNRNL